MKEIVVALIGSLVGVVPAVLLYLQAKASGERESADRNAERMADEKRRARELTLEQMRLEVDGRSTAAEQRRQRHIRLLRIAQQLDIGVHDSSSSGRVYEASAEERSELATAYEEVMFDADGDLAYAVSDMREGLDNLLASARKGGQATQDARRNLSRGIEHYRQTAQRALGPREGTT